MKLTSDVSKSDLKKMGIQASVQFPALHRSTILLGLKQYSGLKFVLEFSTAISDNKG